MVINPGSLSYTLSGELAKLHERAFAGHARGWSAGEITGLTAAPAVLLIVDDALTPSGFSLFRQVDEEAELLSLAVDPEKWNNGLGRALLDEGCKELVERGCKLVFLEVSRGNDRALALYRGAGFSIVGQRLGYYNPDETGTAYLMRLPLAPPTS